MTDLLFSDNALRILNDRYLRRDRDGNVLETPQEMLERASFGVPEFYDIMARLEFLPNTPALMNAGTGNSGTLSACFCFHLPDSLDGIMDVAVKAASVLKWGGGAGYVLSNLRPQGSWINGTNSTANGPVPFLHIFQSLAAVINQGGRRRGAQMAVLSVRHPDVLEFIRAKNANPQSLSTFNLSVAVDKEFMADVCGSLGDIDPDSYAFPDDHPVTTWQEIVRSAWRTGDPGLYFIDTAEAANPTPWLGKLLGTNPCGEVPLLDNEPCNLGSLNLSKFVSGMSFDWAALENATRTAVRFLDHILDENHFPHPDIEHMARSTRKLGLGVMGWADALALLRVPYDNERAVELAEQVMKTIKRAATAESLKLGGEKGPAPALLEGPYFLEESARRNATVTCIAPTGTIALLAGCSSGIEPHYATEWERHSTINGGMTLKDTILGRFGGFVPKTAHNVNWEWHVQHQAAFQKYTDLAVSKTVNLPHSATTWDISRAMQMAWGLGCKGITVFRDGCRNGNQALYSTTTEQATPPPADSGAQSAMAAPFTGVSPTQPVERRRLPADRPAHIHKFSIDGVEGYIIVGLYGDGRPGELFLKVSKEGSMISGLLDTLGAAVSIALQHGVLLDTYIQKFKGTRFEPLGLTENKDVPTVLSVVDYLARFLELQYGHKQDAPQERTGDGCPQCGSGLYRSEGCLHCSQCDWIRC